MENLFEITKILIANLTKNSTDIKDSFLDKLKQLKNPQIKPLVNISHIKNHLNYWISLKRCNERHCLQCLFEDIASAVCSHSNKLTEYEKAHLKEIIEYLPFVTQNRTRMSFKLCISCQEPYNTSIEAAKTCDCHECGYCIIGRYRAFELNCSFCMKSYENTNIKEIAELSGIEEIEIIEVCQKCKLPIYSKGMLGDQCFICAEESKINEP